MFEPTCDALEQTAKKSVSQFFYLSRSFRFILPFIMIGIFGLGNSVLAQDHQASYAVQNPKKEGIIRVHFIDIGQGDSALIEGPTGKRVLIDSGPSKSGNRLVHYLKALGVERIDLMINTHPHADHIGNATRILKSFQVGLVLDSGWVHPIKAYRDLLDTVEELKIPIKIARKGRIIDIGGGAQIHILGPEDPLIRNSRSDPNSNSIVFRMTYKDEQALFTGDAEEETESRLLRAPEFLRANLLKVAHHGSSHASSDHFLSTVQPVIAVISCSEQNRYGHPAPETLTRLEKRKIEPWVTATKGTLVAETNGHGWSLNGGKVVNSRSKSPQTQQIEAMVTSQQNEATALQVNTEESTKAGLININQASATDLQGLPGIGPALSERILKHRQENGPYQSVDDLRKVKGIGPKTVTKLAPLIRF